MGAWAFANSFIEEVAEEAGCKNPRPRYAGRPSAASPATGSNRQHQAEQAALIEDALTLGKKAVKRIAAKKAAHAARQNGAEPASEKTPAKSGAKAPAKSSAKSGAKAGAK